MREDPRGAGPVARTARRPVSLFAGSLDDIRMTEQASMPIATFAPTTQWAGTRITWAGEQFLLENHGPIAAGDVMFYDEQGWLEWADAGTRAWVGARAAAQARSAAPGVLRAEASARAQRIFIVAIGVILAIILVLLIVLARTEGLI